MAYFSLVSVQSADHNSKKNVQKEADLMFHSVDFTK